MPPEDRQDTYDFVATFNGQEIGTIQAIDYAMTRSDTANNNDTTYPSSSLSVRGDNPDESVLSINTEGTVTLGYRSILADELRTTVPEPIWRTTPPSSEFQIGRITSPTERMADYMEDYLRNRNEENPIFINHNTSQRPIEYNDIADVIEFREYLDSKIKEYYQRG